MKQNVIQVLDLPSPRRPAECVVEDWLAFLGHRWNALILWHMSTGPKRFSELRELLPGITSKVLSERLETPIHRQLLERSTLSVFPRGSSYHITGKGRGIIEILDQIEVWASV